MSTADVQLSPGHAGMLIAKLTAQPEPEAPASALLGELTAREREVVTLVARGLSNRRSQKSSSSAPQQPRPTQAAR